MYKDKRLPDRFWEKIDVNEETGCWEWNASRNNSGYGCFMWSGKTGAHRTAYIELVGDIPEHLECDHKCRVRHCVNPAHIELVTSSENKIRSHRSTHARKDEVLCRKGIHRIDDEANVYTSPSGVKACRPCKALAARRFRAKNASNPDYQARKRAYSKKSTEKLREQIRAKARAAWAKKNTDAVPRGPYSG